ncbi:hypothetical protein [Shewanella ulleungensis]|uniref:Uncharacterized protein n=1 Tax=Shewanella ulleungensis TaxID=2282699 RepID=A0ABQ2QVS1_9GAMM|nr:hypothetical protein [Shewanella ulleungensis]MCL1151272.1 hypothetical protein [Shewanella ulleungensis]GGP96901.1 hypothetical protein GCM10009410_33490 [Shewanella ulleungensis]
MGPLTRFAYSSIPLPLDDVRAHLPEDMIKSNHPEVSISYKGERLINDPKEDWFEFTGKKAGRAKCSNSKSKEKCDEYSKKYQSMKEEANRVISSMK